MTDLLALVVQLRSLVDDAQDTLIDLEVLVGADNPGARGNEAERPPLFPDLREHLAPTKRTGPKRKRRTRAEVAAAKQVAFAALDAGESRASVCAAHNIARSLLDRWVRDR